MKRETGSSPAIIAVAMAFTLVACSAAERNQITKQNGKPAGSGAVAGAGATAESRMAGFAQGVTRPAIAPIWVPVPRADRETYEHKEQQPVREVATAPVSTFSIDVDTGAYANVRRFLNAGRLPPRDAVRVEECVNYFDYDYPLPESRDRPFRVYTEIGRTPWNRDTRLLHIGIKGFDVPREERPPANVVFLVDVSGSMKSPDKLPLVVSSLKLFLGGLTARDRISVVTYAGTAGVALEPTPGDRKEVISAALDRLSAGGSTAGEAGLKLAYSVAEGARIDGGINRVVVASDGDFNVGMTDRQAFSDMIARKRRSGIALTLLGFGTGNLNDAMLERIADVGNGNYAYIDSAAEARKVLRSEINGTLMTIAKDVKIQIEFNPAVVAEYRLIGYENRALRRDDFANDKVDAGEIGAGHTVTALYEIALVGSGGRRLKPLRYAGNHRAVAGNTRELAFLRLRYKRPDGGPSQLMETPLRTAMLDEALPVPSESFRFAAAVAAFGQALKGGTYMGGFRYAEIVRLARMSRGRDPEGHRAGFISLVELAEALDTGS